MSIDISIICTEMERQRLHVFGFALLNLLREWNYLTSGCWLVDLRGWPQRLQGGHKICSKGGAARIYDGWVERSLAPLYGGWPSISCAPELNPPISFC